MKESIEGGNGVREGHKRRGKAPKWGKEGGRKVKKGEEGGKGCTEKSRDVN